MFSSKYNELRSQKNNDDLPTLFKECKFAFLGVGQIKSADLRNWVLRQYMKNMMIL